LLFRVELVMKASSVTALPAWIWMKPAAVAELEEIGIPPVD
jgi:hypothetical protein